MVRRERGQFEEAEALLRARPAADGRRGRSGDGELGAQQPGDGLRAEARRRRGRPGDRPPQLRADRAPRRRLLAQPGPGQPRPGRSSPPRTTRRPWPRSRRPSGSTARRWATAARWRPGAAQMRAQALTGLGPRRGGDRGGQVGGRDLARAGDALGLPDRQPGARPRPGRRRPRRRRGGAGRGRTSGTARRKR